MKSALTIVALLLAVSAPAAADKGALSIDAGGGVSIVRTPTPYTQGSVAQSAWTPTIWIDARYALSNRLELTASAFYETGTDVSSSNVMVPTDTGTFTGTMQFHAKRFGAMAGARGVRGAVWRFLFGAELGVSVASYSGARLLNSSGQDIGIGLSDTMTPSLAIAPSVGIAWVADHLTIALVPRAELLLGTSRTWAVSAPLTIGWDFYVR